MASREEAPRAENGGSAWGAIYAMTLCVFVLIASEFMPVSLLSPIAHDLALTSGQAGQAISVSGFFAFLTSLLIPYVIGHRDRRHVMLGLTALLIVSGTITAMAPNYAVLILARAVLGMAIGGFWSMSAAVTTRLVSTEFVAKAFAITNGGNALASIIAGPLGSFVGGIVGWRWAFFCVVPLAVVALFWQARVIPPLPAEQAPRTGRLLAVIGQTAVSLGLIGEMVFFGGMFMVFIYLRPFLEQVTGVSFGLLSALLLLVGASGFIGTMLIGRVIGSRIHLLLAVLAAILAVTAVCLSAFGASLTVTIALLAVWGLVFTASPVAWWTWLARAVPDDLEAGGALMVAGVQISIMIGASVGGVVVDALGVRADFLCGTAVLAVAAVLALLMGRPKTSA